MNVITSANDALEFKTDAFSQLLTLLKLDVSIYHNAKVCGDWRITEHQPGATCFHMATLGSLRLEVPGHFSGPLHAGDLVIFPRELPHCMTPAVPQTGEQCHLAYREAREREGTGLLCGAVRLEHEGWRFILDALPPVFVIRYDPGRHWLRMLLELFLAENLTPATTASKAIFDKLSELLFTYALRHHLTEHPEQVGMLAVYGHPRLVRAVEAIHGAPEQHWTLESLARAAGLSRTGFAETFKAVSGGTAGQYLGWWRMQVAWSLLRSGQNLAETADQVGYRSEAAFSRAFLRMFGKPAGQVRNKRKG